MNKYEYFVINNEENIDYILATSSEDMYFQYDDIYDELSKQKGSRFEIIIDLVIRNGFTFNRFILLEFSENKIKSSIINPREVPDEIKNRTKRHFQENKFIVLDSTLSKSTKDFILRS